MWRCWGGVDARGFLVLIEIIRSRRRVAAFGPVHSRRVLSIFLPEVFDTLHDADSVILHKAAFCGLVDFFSEFIDNSTVGENVMGKEWHMRACRYFRTKQFLGRALCVGGYALLLCVVLTSMLHTQSVEVTIRGKLVDAATGLPVPHANVSIKGTGWGTSSDTMGEFTLRQVPAGIYTLVFTHVNYDTVVLRRTFHPESQPIFLVIELQGRAIPLEPVEVVETLRGGYVNSAYIVTREDIVRANVLTFGDVIQYLVPRAWVREESGNLFIQLQLRSVLRRFGRRETNPLIIVDGMKLGNSPIGLAQLIDPSEIQTLEVLRPPEAEALYGPEARYGVIIIQTLGPEKQLPQNPLLPKWVLWGGVVGAALILLLLF
jgi:hypothetical protein